MGYKILSSSRKRSQYEFIIKGEEDWALHDLFPLMAKVSERSRDYYLSGDLEIRDRRSSNRASFELCSTLSPSLKKLLVRDEGIGKQMIEKFVESIQED